MDRIVLDKPLSKWIEQYPLIKEMVHGNEVVWLNPERKTFVSSFSAITLDEIFDAEQRLARFAPFLMAAFPETKISEGIIESNLVKIDSMKHELENQYQVELMGGLYLKEDHALPIAGSVKARGGIYEVLKVAERIALNNGLQLADNYETLLQERFKPVFSQHAISVGSTGNLGLSIGIMSAKLGFNVTVHMSSDAKEWKKDLLRKNNVTVVEHASDYSKAVEMGRAQCNLDSKCHFIDDENSKDLFLGYAVAALRLQQQFKEKNIVVDEEHPLVVYLPCGVGGAPGGIAYGLKMIFGDHVHCFFAEPTQSPCMLLGLLTDKHDQVSVQDFGISNRTDADGLAVGRPSGFVGKVIGPYLNGVYTVEDDQLYRMLYLLNKTEKKKLEPSALAGMYGPVQLEKNNWFESNFTRNQLKHSTHVVWSTGGILVPNETMKQYIEKGFNLYK